MNKGRGCVGEEDVISLGSGERTNAVLFGLKGKERRDNRRRECPRYLYKSASGRTG